jgi:hypothetical protein
MAELEGAKFDAQKPMIELQQAEAKEKLAPVTIYDIGIPDAPPHIKNITFTDNKIEGLQPNIVRIARAMGADGLQNINGVPTFVKNGKPVPRYVLKSDSYLKRSRPILQTSIDPLRNDQSTLAMLEDIKAAGKKFTPEQQRQYETITKRSDADYMKAYRNKLKNLHDEILAARNRGDNEFANDLLLQAQWDKEQYLDYKGRVDEKRAFEQQKELIEFENTLNSRGVDKTNVGQLIDERNALAAANPNSPDIAHYDAAIQKATSSGGSDIALQQTADLYSSVYNIPMQDALDMARNDEMGNKEGAVFNSLVKAYEMELFQERDIDKKAAIIDRLKTEAKRIANPETKFDGKKYGQWLKRYKIQSPNDPRHNYDYRAAFESGIEPTLWDDLPENDKEEDIWQAMNGQRTGEKMSRAKAESFYKGRYMWPDTYKTSGHRVPSKEGDTPKRKEGESIDAYLERIGL